MAVVEFIVSVDVRDGRSRGAVGADERDMNVRERIVLADVVIAVDVIIGVDVTRNRDRFRTQREFRIDARLVDAFVSVVDVVRKERRIKGLGKSFRATIFAVVIVDEESRPSFREVMVRGENRRDGRAGDSVDDRTAHLAAFDERVVRSV